MAAAFGDARLVRHLRVLPMRWTSAIAALGVPPDWMTRWPWLVVSLVPDILLVAGLIWLWRHLVRSRRQADREVAAARTELRTAEAASAAQTVALDIAQRLQVVAENAADIVMETDDDGIIRWITPTVVQRTGRRPEELVGTAYFQHVHPDDAATVRSLERQAQQEGADGQARRSCRPWLRRRRRVVVRHRPLQGDQRCPRPRRGRRRARWLGRADPRLSSETW
jgi:PAS domain S-box-containing protein